MGRSHSHVRLHGFGGLGIPGSSAGIEMKQTKQRTTPTVPSMISLGEAIMIAITLGLVVIPLCYEFTGPVGPTTKETVHAGK